MAYEYNYKFWLATANEINDIQLKEAAYIKLGIVTDRLLAHDIFAELYSRYVALVNKLGYIYSRSFQVQKREIIEKLLKSASDRLIELRNELKNIEMSEFIYLDKTLIQKKLIPDDILLLIPPYFPYWRPHDIERILTGPRIIETVLTLTEEEEEARKKAAKRPQAIKIENEIILTPEQRKYLDSINMIQRHERARIARILLTNILYHPEKYKPKPMSHSSDYTFSHKPDQLMLIPVRVTKFEANYYIEKKTGGEFNYYVKPKRKEKIYEQYDDEELNKYQDMSTITLTEFFEPATFIEKQIAERTPHNIEDYFILGMLDLIEQEYDDDSRIKKLTSSELLHKKISFRINYAAKKIQRQWHIYKDNKLKKQKELLEKMLLGMASERIVKKNPLKQLFHESDLRRAKVEKFREEFQTAIENERNRIVRVKSPWIMEDISDQTRAWFKEFYDGCGEFHPFPDAAKGGTILVLTGETLDVREYIIEKGKPKLSKEEKKKIRDKAKADKKKEKEKLLKLKRAEAKIRAMNIARGGVYFNMKEWITNPNLTTIKETMDHYNDEWRFVDEKNNITEDPFMEWIKLDLFAEIHRELRGVVDELMRIEYELLRQALAKDLKKKYKPPKPKKNKGKKGKRGKKGKGKKVKDLTADRSIPSLYYELEDAGIIKSYNSRYMAEFIGDINYLAYEIRNYFEMDSIPSMGEVRDIFREWILGMGPLNLKKPKSILIAGPCSKHKLCDILASEINAVVIDLSPENVIRYENDLPYLINLVNKIARLFQPTIILINEVHRVYWKKVPKEMKHLKPQLLSSILFKQIVKPIKLDEKIFVLGTTSEPWAAKRKMSKAFEKILLLPKTDYASSFILWRTICLKYIGVPRDFEFSPLSLVTKNYTSGNIINNIEKTINITRRMKFSRKPLQPQEFIETFLSIPLFPPEDKETMAYTKWFNKTNKLQKQRVKYMKKVNAMKNKKK